MEQKMPDFSSPLDLSEEKLPHWPAYFPPLPSITPDSAKWNLSDLLKSDLQKEKTVSLIPRLFLYENVVKSFFSIKGLFLHQACRKKDRSLLLDIPASPQQLGGHRQLHWPAQCTLRREFLGPLLLLPRKFLSGPAVHHACSPKMTVTSWPKMVLSASCRVPKQWQEGLFVQLTAKNTSLGWGKQQSVSDMTE